MNNSWNKKKLGEVCMIERGGSPRPITDYLTDSPEGINWIKIGDAVDGSKFITSTAEKIKPEGMKKSRFVQKGDFILSNSMSFGKPYILAIDGCIHDGWLVIRDTNNAFDKSFLYYYLSSDRMYHQFEKMAAGGVVKNLNSQLVRSVDVVIPPIEEQKRIVNELDLITGIIDKKNAQLRDLDALAQSIFHDMFGGNTSSWPSHRLGDICDTTSGGTPSKSHSEYYLNGTIPWLRSGEVEGTNITDTEIKITDLGVKYSSAKWFPVQTVVVAMYGATVGEVGILGKPMTTNQAVCGILPNGSLRPLYLYSWFRSKKMDFVEQATGGAQPNISQNIIRNSKICCPPLEIQDSFVERLASIEEQKLMVEKSTRDTQSLLDCRMDLYFG